MRLGVARALVDGELLVGDVELDSDGRVVAVGVGPGVGSLTAVPGLVDLQVNGVAGIDFRSADRDGYALAASVLAGRGATAVQPTFYSQPVDAYVASLARLAEVSADPPPGCRMLPAHLEGPFLAPSRRGAHREVDLLGPDPEVLQRLLDAGPVGCMTLAPELDGATELIGHLVRAGVVAAIGHTDATAAQVHTAVDAGARLVTHCWNAQRPPTARDPGPVGVALSESRLVVGLIADLVHVSTEVALLTMAAAAGRVAATTDAVALAGLDPAEWPDHDGAPRWVDGAPRLPDGTIAGGIALPDECLRNLVAVGVSLADAVDACGGVQRRLLGLPDVRLRPGDPAEVLVLDHSLQPVRTVIGNRVFEPA